MGGPRLLSDVVYRRTFFWLRECYTEAVFRVFRELFLLRAYSRSSSGGSPSRNLERDSRDYRKVFFAIYRSSSSSSIQN